MGNRHYATVHRTRLLLREPLSDAGIAESMLAMRCLPSVGGQVPCSQGSNPLMPPLSATQEMLPVAHLVGSSPTESSFPVISSITKGMDVMSQSGALALEAVWTLRTPARLELRPQRPRDNPGAVSQPFLGGEGEGKEREEGSDHSQLCETVLCPAHRCYATRRKLVTKPRLFALTQTETRSYQRPTKKASRASALDRKSLESQ